MAVVAVTPEYHSELRDTAAHFHGQQLLNISWDQHLLYASPLCVLVAPDLKFGDWLQQGLPQIYGNHPNWPQIDWSTVQWRLRGAPFVPDLTRTMAENGLGHKALLEMYTPGLSDLGAHYH